MKDLYVIANAAYGKELSGGDRIFIEFSRRWQGNVKLLISEDGFNMCKRSDLKNVGYKIWTTSNANKTGFFITYFIKILQGMFNVIVSKQLPKNTVLYSASDFLPDSIPAFLFKMKNKKIKWVAGFYLFAPSVSTFFSGASKRKFRVFRDISYWLTQKIAYCLILRFSDCIFVTSEPDRQKFIRASRDEREVVVIKGGVTVDAKVEYVQPADRKYDACFLGRLHPQKGVLELVDIWEIVCKKKTDAKLAIIGDGELKDELMEKIASKGLKNNIVLFGFMDGDEKNKIFMDSKMMLHPALYDSGGMSAAEGMAYGLPAVGFDLPHLVEYYPKGMLKAEAGNVKKFTLNIIDLLENKELYNRTSKDAKELICTEWTWDKRMEAIIEKLKLAEVL